ncbi:MAG: hypothetical protein OXG43_04745 [Chloroflexi bacterium]|nr:hypothetical protein [Chloroflexota bacterium]
MATQLRKIWLSVHSLTWLALPPDSRERMDRMWNQFTERIPLAYPLEQKLQREYQRLIDAAGEDEAIYFLPTQLEAADEIIEYADARLGDRSMASRVEGGAAAKERALGGDFFQGVEDDQRAAICNRGLADGVLTADQLRQDGAARDKRPNLPGGGLQQTEIRGWMQAKAWGLDLLAQAESRGLEFDPATVEMEAFGGDWCYCAASFPIQIGRAMGLSNPIERRFDLINPAEGPVLLQSEVVEQNIRLADNIRLFIWEYTDSHGPRYLAQFWEGIRGIMDRTHEAVVDLPADAAQIVNLWGFPETRARGVDTPPRHEPLRLSVGSGGHTPIASSIVMTDGHLPLNEFRDALTSAEIRRC